MKAQKGKSRVAHVSDLHFGKVDSFLVEALLQELIALKPELIIISGDLTMRARTREFLAARDFLDKLRSPWVCVPGNHDIPLWRISSRMLTPYSRYRRYVSRQLLPRYEGDRFAVFGLNTARRLSLKSLDWSRGRISAGQLAQLRSWFETIDRGKYRIVFGHHPFALPPQSIHRGAVGRLNLSIETFTQAHIDLLLAGHLHQTFWTNIPRVQHSDAPRAEPIVALQASTATSTRLKGECNAFNVIDIEPDTVQIDQRSWDGEAFYVAKSLHQPRGTQQRPLDTGAGEADTAEASFPPRRS